MTKRKATTIEHLQSLEPLTALSKQRLEELLPLTELKQLAMGQSLFREGDVDNQVVYLLEGDVQMRSADGKLDLVLSHTATEARYPLDDSQPHVMSCVAMSKVQAIYIDNSVLDYLMTWDQIAIAESASSLADIASLSNTPPPSTEDLTEIAPNEEQVERSKIQEPSSPDYSTPPPADKHD